jgi:hypothetical protein
MTASHLSAIDERLDQDLCLPTPLLDLYESELSCQYFAEKDGE